MTWTRAFQTTRFLRLDITRVDRHDIGPVGPVFVFDQDSERGTKCQTMSDTAENLCVIFFDLHSTTATVSQLSLSQFVVDESHVDRQACRETFENRYESASV